MYSLANMSNHSFNYNGTEYNPSLIAGDYVSERIRTDNTFYEIEQLEYQKELLNGTEGTILDVGSHIGTHAMYYATQMFDKDNTGYNNVIGFECSAKVFEVLKLNANQYNNIQVFNVGLYGHNRKAKLYSGYENNSGSNSVIVNNIVGEQVVVEEVNLVTLDYFIHVNKQLAIDKVRFIKFDIEGAEANALLGSLNTLKTYRPLIYCECHKSYQIENILSILHKFNYKVLSEINEHIYFKV